MRIHPARRSCAGRRAWRRPGGREAAMAEAWTSFSTVSTRCCTYAREWLLAEGVEACQRFDIVFRGDLATDERDDAQQGCSGRI